jgi:hypothetical protein
MMLRGWANGESGTPKANTQLAPNEAISQGVPLIELSQPVTPMAMTTPMNDIRLKRRSGAGGALDLGRRIRGMAITRRVDSDKRIPIGLPVSQPIGIHWPHSLQRDA